MVRLRSREILPTKPISITHPLSPQPRTPAQTKESSLHKSSPSPITASIRRKSQRLVLNSDSINGFFLYDRKEESLMGFGENEAYVFDSESERMMETPKIGSSRSGVDLDVGKEESLYENGVNVSGKETPIVDSTERMNQHLGLELNSGNGFDLNVGNEVSLDEIGENVSEKETPIADSKERMSHHGNNAFDVEIEEEIATPFGCSTRRKSARLGSKRKKETAVDKEKEDDGAVYGLIDDGGYKKIGQDGDGVEKRKRKEIEESDRSNSWGRRLRRREEKGKVVDIDDTADNALPGMHETDLEDDMKSQVSNDGSSSKGRKRYNSEEKGKAKLEGNEALEDRLKMELESTLMELNSKMMDFVEKNTGDKKALKIDSLGTYRVSESRMDHFRRTARENASKFAHFNSTVEGLREETTSVAVEEKVEDWPGPFSTAMKIIKDREKKLNSSHGTTESEKAKRAPITWIPKNNKGGGRSKKVVPPLQELCIKILAKNVDNITSLECVPDTLRHRLCRLLCDTRHMNLHFFNLLVSDSPTEIRIKDCSWLTDEDFEKCFASCDTCNLAVLQLDQCGRCMPDYILSGSLAHSPNSLPTLTTLSLNGGCRISDVGLSSIVSSAPALKSLNISRCSLLSSDSIGILANSLGSVLQELYIDDCQNMDPMAILPALKRLQQLQVLSVAGILKVCDSFVKEFLVARGHNMKELILSDCVKLTDSSVKVIAETCPGLCTLDLINLRKLTDSALGYLANGCREIQKLRLCRNSFSDEAVAAFLESSGEHLTELSLNNVRKVDHITALSIAKCSKMLQSLDLSWCRNLTDEALGLIVDCCLSLKVLKLFGCGQITNVFLLGHSNPDVQIIGFKMSPLLDVQSQPSEYPLHYSS